MRRTQAGGATAQSRCALPQASPTPKTPSSCPHVQAPAHPLALWQSRARSWFSALFPLSLPSLSTSLRGAAALLGVNLAASAALLCARDVSNREEAGGIRGGQPEQELARCVQGRALLGLSWWHHGVCRLLRRF